MIKWCLWVILISSTDGSVISERLISQPKTIAECIELQAGHFSNASEGKVEFYECRRSVTI